jgi:hypothetical protein
MVQNTDALPFETIVSDFKQETNFIDELSTNSSFLGLDKGGKTDGVKLIEINDRPEEKRQLDISIEYLQEFEEALTGLSPVLLSKYEDNHQIRNGNAAQATNAKNTGTVLTNPLRDNNNLPVYESVMKSDMAAESSENSRHLKNTEEKSLDLCQSRSMHSIHERALTTQKSNSGHI